LVEMIRYTKSGERVKSLELITLGTVVHTRKSDTSK